MEVREEGEDRTYRPKCFPQLSRKQTKQWEETAGSNSLSGIHKAFWVKFLEAKRQPE